MRNLKKIGLCFVLGALLLFVPLSLWYEYSHTNGIRHAQAPRMNELVDVVPAIRDRKGVELSTTTAPSSLSFILDNMTVTTTLDESVTLSIDSELQSVIYESLVHIAKEAGYQGGAGIVMDVTNGELLALVSYSASADESGKQENRATENLYMPGSTIKPFLAVAALAEGIIEPDTKILSEGYILVPDQNEPSGFLEFRDWRRHGYVDMREAIGLSSNVYFYTIGGGYKDQTGLGIERIERYLDMFGIGQRTGIIEFPESRGRLPSPSWKAEFFNGDEWRTADTYLASIGQHGYQVTPLQMVRAVAAIANDGKLCIPHLMSVETSTCYTDSVPIASKHFVVVREGMEFAVEAGTALGLLFDELPIAAKTGTTEVDIEKTLIHSWVMGYFPSSAPRYAFVFLLDDGPWGEEVGAVAAARQVFVWMRDARPEYGKVF